jgi:DNA-binding MarR family transcriptional regulator
VRQGLTDRAPGGGAPEASLERLATGLHKIGLVLRQAAWRDSSPRGLTPTQAQLLTLLVASPAGRRLAELAAELGITAASASDSLAALERKGLVTKSRAVGDGRALAARPTAAGRRLAGRLALWPDFLLAALGELDEAERDAFQRALVKMIRSLQM